MHQHKNNWKRANMENVKMLHQLHSLIIMQWDN